MLKKAGRNSDEAPPDVRADEPERTMEKFESGLRRVLAAEKPKPLIVNPRDGRGRRTPRKTSG